LTPAGVARIALALFNADCGRVDQAGLQGMAQVRRPKRGSKRGAGDSTSAWQAVSIGCRKRDITLFAYGDCSERPVLTRGAP
jgi:hypothetical protein